MNINLIIGAILGLTSVMMAAYLDHSLALNLTGHSLKQVLTALRYHQLYAVIISVMGLCIPMQLNYRIKDWLARSAYLFTAGVLLFSAGIYCASIFEISALFYLAPIGGVLLMGGWACLIRTALLRR